MTETLYVPSTIKRSRMTRADKQRLHDHLLVIVHELKPMTVRQVFYQATVRDLVEKSEAGYRKIQRALAEMRRADQLPWSWIADNTRLQRRPETFEGPGEALAATAQFYRKSLWADADVQMEIWLEKDALSGVVFPVTSEYDVPLMVARGYASLSFLHTAAEQMNAIGKTAFIYHLGDFDPSGQNAADKIHEELRRYADQVDVHFEKLAVTPDQIRAWDLPTRPTKKTDTRSRTFGKVSVELDAIDPHRLRALVRDAIELHLPRDQLKILKVAERSERMLLEQWADLAEQNTVFDQ